MWILMAVIVFFGLLPVWWRVTSLGPIDREDMREWIRKNVRATGKQP